MRWHAMALGCAVLLPGSVLHARPAQAPPSVISANDNRAPAGVLRDSVLTIDLVAGAGTWFPEDSAGPGHDVYAFGSAGGGLSNPGPLIRVPAGTVVQASVRNDLPLPLTVHGLFARPGAAAPLVIPPRATARVRFRADAPGTYHYWGTIRSAARLADRFGPESQLVGAVIVDPAGAVADDHVFVIGIEDDSAALPAQRRVRAAVVNGRSWPHSHTASVQMGDTVRMRWINVSDRFHPMHLHGFYFRVDARGDAAVDTSYAAERRRLAVTELLAPGQTMALTWVPERPGNWLMHCHMAEHMSAGLRGRPAAHNLSAVRNHALEVMSGIVTGWRVLPPPGSRAVAGASPLRPRRLRLLVQAAPRRFGEEPGLGFVIQDGDNAPAADSVVIPGPPLVLVRNQPVSITVVNRLDEPTSIHWHGIELDSYYDGVPGWSGNGASVAPHIAPGDSFDVRFTPPRAGTFIYHSHFDEQRQLASGMYGAIVVLEPGQRWDPDADRIWILSQDGPAPGVRALLNGSAAPVSDMQPDRRYRVRLINISPNVPLTLSVLADSTPVLWRMIAKDGADLPAAQLGIEPAVVRIGVGETYDFELAPEREGELALRAVNPFGALQLTGRIRVRPPQAGGNRENR